MEEEEILDLVDKDDKVIGQIVRSETDRLSAEKLGFTRAVDMFIKNSEGQVWIPKRTADKKIAPSGLDYSCGGHVTSGDSYDSTMVRETEEELNFTPDPKRLHYIIKMPPISIPYFRAVYIYDSNETPDYNPNDFVSAEWMTPSALLQKLDSGVASKRTIKETVLKLQELGQL